MPLPLTISCFSKIQIGFYLTWVVPEKGPLNVLCCVLVGCVNLVDITSVLGCLELLVSEITCCVVTVYSVFTTYSLSLLVGQQWGAKVRRYSWHSLAISSAEMSIYFSDKMYGSNFIKQNSETLIVWNYQNDDCSLWKKKLLCHLLFSALNRQCFHTVGWVAGRASGM